MKSPNLDETNPVQDGTGEPISPLAEDAHDFGSEAGLSPDVDTSLISASSPARNKVEPARVESPQMEEAVADTTVPPIDETQPSQTGEDGLYPPVDIPDLPEEHPRGGRAWIVWAIVGVLLLVLIAAGSAYAGYNSAVDQRTRYQSTLVSGEATNQYILAQQDIAMGNYDRARQRLEYIIQIDPNYPNASDQLAFILTQQRITASPTFAPTPTLTPTPDFRTRDEMFTQAQQMLVARDWTSTIDTLLLLRKNYPDYMPVKVDDMLFVALRNRGIDKIAQLHDLEGGDYDLSLADRFGPLDAEAQNWRDWAELYIRGASFWDVDWAQSVSYFSQLANAAPNLSDSSGWTASNRYMDALLGYGEWLANKGEWCTAQTQYDTYMSQLASSNVEPTAVYVAGQCASGAGAPSTPGTPGIETTPGSVTPAPSDGQGLPPASTPIPTDTQIPGSTPYP